jgi:polyisoprenoid-binding protein YceI
MIIKNFFLIALIMMVFSGLTVAADTFTIDPSHSNIGFSVRHLVISNVKGTFADFAGTIVYDSSDVTKSSVNVTIKVASINTAVEARDTHLKSPDFFDAAKYPEITFQSTKVEKTDSGLMVYGKFTMHGVTKDIAIPFAILGTTKDPWGNFRLGAEGTLSINRLDYGLAWSKLTEAGGLVVGNEVKIDLNVEAVKKQ